MPYVGDSLVSLFDAKQQEATKRTARRLADRAGDIWQDVTTQNTPIGGRAGEGGGGGNLRASWYVTEGITGAAGSALGSLYSVRVQSDVSYAPYVEYGTGLYGPKHAKYKISPKTPGGFLRWMGAGGPVFARTVMHPGSPGQHMLSLGGHAADAAMDSGAGDDILAEWVQTIERGAGAS